MPMRIDTILHNLIHQQQISDEDCLWLLTQGATDETMIRHLREAANEMRKRQFGAKIYLRGLIEISNHCRNNCYYCGIRRDNRAIVRYRLSKQEILSSAQIGYALGYRTFVLQGGEDAGLTDALLTDIIASLKDQYPDCAITLSLGERTKESYRRLKEAGADRYLLRHETANGRHYALLHPKEMSFQHRIDALYDLKELGYQVGCGMMIGSPGQTVEHLLEDIRLIEALQPQMVGIGPFLPQKDTPYAKEPAGSVQITYILLALIRLLLPNVLLPATTALNTAAKDGRIQGILSGANVVMPNLSPDYAKKQYQLYDHKVYTGAEEAKNQKELRELLQAIGCVPSVSRGDYKENLLPNDKKAGTL